jgi:hypothetical protein
VALALALAGLGPAVPHANAAVTVGMVAPSTPSAICSGDFDLVQESPTVSYEVPAGIASPVITQWSTNAAPGDGQQLALKVFEKIPVPGATFRQVAHDGPRVLTGGTMNTFTTELAVRAGDFLGVGFQSGSAPNGCLFGSEIGNWTRIGYLGDGETGDFHAETGYVNVAAVIEPSNSFTIGTIRKNRRRGTARISVTVPGPGSLALSGKGVRAQRASGGAPLAAKAVSGAGTVKLLVRARGPKRLLLDRSGRVKVKLLITYTPTGGTPASEKRNLKLRKL